MTLPKAISDAIDAYSVEVSNKAIALFTNNEASQIAIERARDARAALERAIADHVADAGKMVPVAAPTEAEIEAWHKEMRCYIFALLREEPIPGRGAESILRDGLALMRRAAAAKPSEEQRISFAYGNTAIENPSITKDMVREQAAATPAPSAPSALERLRERVQHEWEEDADDGDPKSHDRGQVWCFVLKLIDEEREREAKR